MSEFKDHFSGHAAAYAKSRPGYPRELFAWLAEQSPARGLAWDCATGSGQAARMLAEHFEYVIATDASATQIANAKPAPKVEYRVAPAEQSGLDDASVDLVTVAQALHWFDVDRFYAEVERVLKPGGLLVAWGYHLTRVTPEIDAVIDYFDSEIIGPYWPPERRHVDAHLEDLDFPYAEIDAPNFDMELDWDLQQLLDYISTWSAVQRYRVDKGVKKEHDPMRWLESEIAAFWRRDERRKVSWPLFMRAGRKEAKANGQ